MCNIKGFFNVFFVGILMMTAVSCTKQVQQKSSAINSNEVANLSGSDSIMLALNPLKVIGEYSSRGSRTVYNGQANENGDNIRLILDFFATKKVLPSSDKKHLTCPYGEGKYVDRGWKYIIGYNYKTKQLTLAPNEAMAAGIVPGSFETLYAVYDAGFNSFTFQTRFTALEDNGNESEVIEPLGKTE